MTFQRRKNIGLNSSPATLLAYVDELEAQLETLTNAMAPKDGLANLRVVFDLTGKEATLLMFLADGKTRTKEQLIDGIYWRQPDDTPEPKIIDVFVSKLRRKLAGSGVSIVTVWGSGYFIEGTDALAAAIQGVKPAWDVPAELPPVGKPAGAVARKYGSVRDTVVAYFKDVADANGRVAVTSREVSSVCKTGNAGSVTIRNLERCGVLSVEHAPPGRGRAAGGVWRLQLKEAA